MAKFILFTLLFALLLNLSCALEVAPNSPCAKKCLDDPQNGDPADTQASLTVHQNLACYDWEFVGNNSTDVGEKFANCQECLKDSGYEDSKSGERDTGLFLFNNKATVDWCVFGRFGNENNPNVTDTYPYQQCNKACSSISSSIDYKIKTDPASYSFCDYNGNFTINVDSCTECLYNATSLTILGNVLVAIKETCIEKPGKDFQFEQDIYNATRIQLQSASPSPSSSDSLSTSSVAPDSEDSGLSKGAIAGIVLAGLVVIVLILVGILIFLRRIRRQRESKTVELVDRNGNNTLPGEAYNYGASTPQKQSYTYSHGPVHGHPAEMSTQQDAQEMSMR
ncbi:hypothetical protein EJ04DRAFT_128265 [Polyplosphaeria fusca]|uniref:Uncharacterized protein n=1 Tax=Polyplosphaeria fusca TaxID=682080 RepID=A0A9P4QJW1_9PLEO|nr:hypothetical protein EJ04DRAFT_128265 [Polyplosphaeria fusca]